MQRPTVNCHFFTLFFSFSSSSYIFHGVGPFVDPFQSCAYLTFCLKLLIKKRREFNLETHLLFIDYEKPCDNIQRQILFNILKCRHIPDTLLKAIVDIYTQNKILIKFNNKLSKLVEINKGLCQGYPLSPPPFNIQGVSRL